jgi:hypothetical protein
MAMGNRRFSQLGVSLSGLIFWCVLLGGAALIAMKLFPLYNEKMKVDFALDTVAADPEAGNWGKPDIAKAVMKQFEVSDVDRWTFAEFMKLLDVERTTAGGRVMSLNYEIRGPLFGQLDIVLNYDRALDLPRSASE